MTCQIFELIVKLVAKALFSENIWKISEAVYQTLEKQIVLHYFLWCNQSRSTPTSGPPQSKR